MRLAARLTARSSWGPGLEQARVALAGRALARSGPLPRVEEAVERVFTFSCLGISVSPLQYREELIPFIELVAAQRPSTVVEIGTCRGGTLWLLSRFAAAAATLVSIDLPGGRFGGGYPASRAALYRSFATGGRRIELIRGDSHAAETHARLVQILGTRTIDLLFIDGDHTREGLERDLALYAPLLSPDGLLALLDSVPGPASSVGDVPAVWSELRGGLEARELVRDRSQKEAGIGLLEAAELRRRRP
jgi:cephalosporin hydroxylase